jgi:hypothetical protein
MASQPLAKTVRGQSYRRPQRDRPLRLIYFDPNRDRYASKAFKSMASAKDDLPFCRRRTPPERARPVIVNIERETMYVPDAYMVGGTWQPVSDEVRERVLALKLTREAPRAVLMDA